jgi:hypothetical protein
MYTCIILNIEDILTCHCVVPPAEKHFSTLFVVLLNSVFSVMQLLSSVPHDVFPHHTQNLITFVTSMCWQLTCMPFQSILKNIFVLIVIILPTNAQLFFIIYIYIYLAYMFRPYPVIIRAFRYTYIYIK